MALQFQLVLEDEFLGLLKTAAQALLWGGMVLGHSFQSESLLVHLRQLLFLERKAQRPNVLLICLFSLDQCEWILISLNSLQLALLCMAVRE